MTHHLRMGASALSLHDVEMKAQTSIDARKSGPRDVAAADNAGQEQTGEAMEDQED